MTVTGGEVLTIPVDDGIALRQFTASDAPTIHRTVWNSEEHLGQFNNGVLENFSTLDATRRRIKFQGERYKMLGIWAGEELAGGISLNLVEQTLDSNICELGYWIQNDFTVLGIGSRAVRAASEYALTLPNTNAVGAYIRVGNIASAATAQKGGLQYIALLEDGRSGITNPKPDEWLFAAYKEVPEELQEVFDVEVHRAEILRQQTHRSVAWVSLNGVNKATINHGSETKYIVTSGEVTFLVEGEEPENLKTHDSIVIPKGTKYQDVGRATMYAVCTPAFDPERVEIVRPSTSNSQNASV